MTAQDQRTADYAAKYESLKDQIAALAFMLEDHKTAQETSRDWGYNGDLGRVQELVSQAIQAIKG